MLCSVREWVRDQEGSNVWISTIFRYSTQQAAVIVPCSLDKSEIRCLMKLRGEMECLRWHSTAGKIHTSSAKKKKRNRIIQQCREGEGWKSFVSSDRNNFFSSAFSNFNIRRNPRVISCWQFLPASLLLLPAMTGEIYFEFSLYFYHVYDCLSTAHFLPLSLLNAHDIEIFHGTMETIGEMAL